MQQPAVQEAIREARKTLVAENILDKAVLERKVLPKNAHDEGSYDWRYWSAACLFQQPL